MAATVVIKPIAASAPILQADGIDRYCAEVVEVDIVDALDDEATVVIVMKMRDNALVYGTMRAVEVRAVAAKLPCMGPA